MAKHLDTSNIEEILGVIDGWTSKLTWDSLCDEVAPLIGTRPTRQTLNNHQSIKNAFNNRKKRLKDGGLTKKRPASLDIAAQRIQRLDEKCARLLFENERLLEQYVIWQYNAYRHGLTEKQLNQPLPPVNRE